MARTLNVYLKGELVGQLEQGHSGALRFGYDKAWLASALAAPLSHSLPLRSERFRWKECRPFFAGLLPEEESRTLIAKAFGVSDKNDFALLERIGAECAGAVSLLRPGELLLAAPPRYRKMTLEELADKFAELPRRPLLTGEEGIRLSLAGAQGKLVVAIQEGNFCLPLDGSPSSHILKPQSPHFDGLAENEFFCMRLAAEVGLDVAAAEIGSAGGVRFLQVERFDRKRLADGQLERIHQEDFCQALGIPPELKYQQEGGPNLKKCFELVRDASATPGPDVLKLFDAVVFNFLIGNGDAHGKNFSFLYEGGSLRLAPLYDLVCTQAYPNLSPEMAMKLGDERKPARVFPRNWRKFFKEAGFGQSAAEQRLLRMVRHVQQKAQEMAESGVEGAREVAPAVLANCHRLITADWKSG
jgi:serine/threonine-protein kinase HipA